MGRHLSIITNHTVSCLQDNRPFDDRNGFATLVFGMDALEGCDLLHEIQELLKTDLEFLSYPSGEVFEGMDLQQFLEAITGFYQQAEAADLPAKITYQYINRQYLQQGLKEDLLFFCEFAQCAIQQGASTIRFERY